MNIPLSALDTKAFENWAVVKDCPKDSPVWDYIPTTCECGSDFIISMPDKTQLTCSNPYCYVKMGYALAYFISSLGFSGMGEKSTLALIRDNKDKFEYLSFLSAFLLEPEDIYKSLGEHRGNLFLSIRDSIKGKRWKMKDIIPALGIPGIGKRSKIFDVVQTPQGLLSVILEDRLDELLSFIGSTSQMLRTQLEWHKVDILILYDKIAPLAALPAKKQLYIAITGSVSVKGVPLSRTEFINKISEDFRDPKDDSPVFELIETKAKSKLDCVIADFPSGHSKYIIGKELGILKTADEFYSELESTYKEVITDE